MAGTKTRPADFTGRNAEILAAQAAEEQAARQAEITMLTAEAELASGEVDYTEGMNTVLLPDEEDELPAEVEYAAVEVAVPTKRFRVNSELEDMTFGAGNYFNFSPGVWYTAPKALYDHLDEKGYIWH